VRPSGLEPEPEANSLCEKRWEASILPLNYSRFKYILRKQSPVLCHPSKSDAHFIAADIYNKALTIKTAGTEDNVSNGYRCHLRLRGGAKLGGGWMLTPPIDKMTQGCRPDERERTKGHTSANHLRYSDGILVGQNILNLIGICIQRSVQVWSARNIQWYRENFL
jgi:hypothetical protein